MGDESDGIGRGEGGGEGGGGNRKRNSKEKARGGKTRLNGQADSTLDILQVDCSALIGARNTGVGGIRTSKGAEEWRYA